MPACDSRGLNNDTNNEDTGSNDDADLSRVLLSQEAGQECSDPGAQFQYRGEPTFAGLVCRKFRVVVSHV